jgi:predicted nucleic acid-binding protein
MIESQLVELVNSSVLEYENSRNPWNLPQQAMNRYLQMAVITQRVNETIRERAEQLERIGIKAVDALHIACAEASNSNYFLTCDKRLINRCVGLPVKTLNPIDFILEIEDDNQST